MTKWRETIEDNSPSRTPVAAKGPGECSSESAELPQTEQKRSVLLTHRTGRNNLSLLEATKFEVVC